MLNMLKAIIEGCAAANAAPPTLRVLPAAPAPHGGAAAGIDNFRTPQGLAIKPENTR